MTFFKPPALTTDYDRTISRIFSLKKSGIRMGLCQIKKILELMGNPHDTFPCILVAGTNGKGSTSAMIESILSQSGYKVGLFTSPHLHRFNERIKVGGEEIGDRQLVELEDIVSDAMKSYDCPLTFFEFSTLLAILFFARESVDVSVLEVGMGGRLDATNAVEPVLSVVTNVSREHEDFLGAGEANITREKAGIIRSNVPLVTSAKGLPLSLLEDICRDKCAPVIREGEEFRAVSHGESFDYVDGDGAYFDLKTNLRGGHQVTNASLAIAVVKGLKDIGFESNENMIRRGLCCVRWVGRCEIISEEPMVLVDCAHNPAGMRVLRESLKLFSYDKVILVIGIMNDKDIDQILSIIAPMAFRIIITASRHERAASIERLTAEAISYLKHVEPANDVGNACRRALNLSHRDDIVCVTGSVYVVAEARESILRLSEKGTL